MGVKSYLLYIVLLNKFGLMIIINKIFVSSNLVSRGLKELLNCMILNDGMWRFSAVDTTE
jgi:hypothetical protein